MDSITQFVLGAAIGEAVLGHKEGNKAILWGGLAGTIPDLDVLFSRYMTDLEFISVHRGFSHSLVFSLIAAPPLAWIAKKIHKKGIGTFKDWLLLFFLGLFTHPILDSFTTYGTQLFLPFSDYRVGLNNLFIVDPLYTVPLILCVLICLFLRRDGKLRKQVVRLSLGISTIYIAITLMFKLHVNSVVKDSLAEQNIKYEKFMTGATPFQSILWYSVVKSDAGIYIGYYSLFDSKTNIDFKYYPSQAELLAPFEGSYALNRLKWFSNGYYAARKIDDTYRFYDVKFGRTDLNDGADENAFVWYFEVYLNEEGNTDIKEPPFEMDFDLSEAWSAIWARLKGN